MNRPIPILLLALGLTAWSCGTGDSTVSYSYQVPPVTGDGWETAHLSDRNIEVEPIENMVFRVKNNEYRNIHAILLIRHNRLVLEEYFPGYAFDGEQWVWYDRDTFHFIASCTKSFTSALVGMAFDRGHIPSPDTLMKDLFPEFENIDWSNGKDRITLWHLLTMTAGLDWDEWAVSYFEPDNPVNQMRNYWYPMLFVVNRPMAHEPGTAWAYNSGLSILLGGIIKNTTGWSADDFAERFLFATLGIHDYQWLTLGDHHTIDTGGGLLLKPRDMARLGQLYLDRGTWKGLRVISETWVEESTKWQADRSSGGYGFQWWVERHPWKGTVIESFSAQGLGGQYIFVFRDLDLVVVFTGGNQYTGAEPGPTLIHRFILPAVN